MKRRSIFILLILLLMVLLLMLGGCRNVANDSNKKDSNLSVSSQVNDQNGNNMVLQDDSTSWKKAVAENLLLEFNDYYNKMQTDDNTLFNRIMAADRATGLLCVYKDYISDASLKDIQDKLVKINEKITIGASGVSFGYTSSGLHIIALTEGMSNGSLNYLQVYNAIRKDEQESNLFEDLFSKCSYQVSDIFIEDLSGKRETFDVKVDLIELDGPSFIPKQEVNNVSDNANEILKKYNRIIESKDGSYRNKTWRLVASPFKFPHNYNFLRVYDNGEKIDLGCDATDKQYQGDG